MRVRGVFLAVAVDVRLSEGVAAEDVVDAAKSGGAVGGIACQVVGGGDDLDAVEDVACVGCQWVGVEMEVEDTYCCCPTGML